MKKNLLTLIIMLLLGFFGLVQAQVPLPYTEGFEEGLGSWTLSNCDSNTGISTSASYIHSGSHTFAFHWSTNPPQYLISPEITGATGGVNVEFYYKASSSGSFSETFQVGYSTSTNAVGSFTFGEEITAPVGTDWALYSNTFPAGTKYVAVACTSYDALYFCVDDFTFTAAGGGEMLEAELTVHDATTTNNYVPVYGTWADAYLKCEMVYPASELSAMAGGEISGITYYLSSPASDVWTGTWEVFMYEVDNTTIDNFYGEDRSIVYTGALDGTGATMTINFDTPYTYNGGNLLVGVYQIVPGNWKSAYFYGETVNGASVQGYSSIGLDYISVTQRNFLPKTTFSYLTTPCPDTAMVITPVDGATDIDEANTMLSWQLGNNTQQYCLLFGTDPSNIDTLVHWTSDLSNQYIFNDALYPSTTYYWQVGERNDGCADGVFSNIWSFTTVNRSYTIDATAYPMEGGSVNGADSYFYGTTCTLVATPATGYRFINWTESDTVVSSTNTLTFTVTNDRTLVANFSLTQLDVFADYHPNPADSSGEVVRVHWEEQNAPYIEDFESGDFTKFDWQLDATHPWTITTKNPYEGTFCMKSGGSGVAGAVSNMTVTVDIPDDGIMSFFGKISSETSWDYGYFYIDGVKMKEYSGQSSWGEKKFNITQGTHTFQWSYCKDDSNNNDDDCFYVDCITFYKEPEPVQPGWHTYCESEFNNALGSNVGIPRWAYEYPTIILSSYAGFNITKVSLFSDNMYGAVGGNYTCVIYRGGNEPMAGDTVSTITVDVPQSLNAWVDFDLTTPVPVTGTDTLWVVWTANTQVTSWPAGLCNDQNNYGNWWNPDFEDGYDWEHQTYGTFTMRQYFDNGADKGFYSYGNESTRDLPNYRVYRALCNESGSTLLTDTVTVQEYIDNDWVSLDHGFYKYGVSIEDGPIFWSDSIKNIAVYYNINASTNPSVGGNVTGTGSHERYTTCTLVATPATGYRFINWTESDTVVSNTNTLTFTVTNDRTLIANFSLTQLDVFADYHPNPADSSGEVVRVHWEEQNAPYIEDFESGDFTKFDWQLDATHPWTITTKNPYEGTFCMKSGGSGVDNMESIMTVTVDIPADGQMSFFCKISSENNWDYGYFYIDGVQMGQYTGTSSWKEKKFYLTQGLHTFKWRYKKDNYGNSNDDCFYVDNITFYKRPEPIQPGWHTYCESDFNNAVGSNLTSTPSWAYEYPISFLKSNYAGWYITKVSLFSDNMYNAVGGNHTCNIYVGGAEPASGTMVSTITVDVPSGQNEWVDWDLTTPVNVTGNEPIWIVWTANTTVSSWPAGCCEELNNLGTWWNSGTGWEHQSYGTWTMRQYFDNGADKGFYSYGNESTRDLPNYRVYRALCNESDPTLLTDTVTVQEYLDNDWVSLDHGFYKYGVSIEDGPIYWSDSIKNIAVYYNINASANPSVGGNVTGTGSHERYTTCTLTATPSEGYHFLNWAQNGTSVSTDETFSFTVTQDSTFVANFGLNSYTLTVNYLYADGNTAAPTHTESVNYNAGYSVASPEITGYTPDIATVSGTMGTGNVTVDVTYTINSYTLTINYLYADGNTAAPTHIESVNYNAGYSVDSPEITGYTPDIETVAGTMGTSNVTVDVVYSINSYTLTINYLYADGNTAAPTHTESINYNASYSVASPTITGYTPDIATVAGTMGTSNVTVDVTYTINSYEITATVNPANSGDVEGTGIYNHFSTCTLTAVPATGYHFVNWTLNGVQVSTSTSISFEVTGATTYVANFALNTYNITAMASPINAGSVTGAGTYEHFETCTLTATPAEGFYFVNWTKDGQVVSTNANYSFEVTGSGSFVAHFEHSDVTITAYAVPANSGSVTGAGEYVYGSTCTLTATPAIGRYFVKWTKGTETVSTEAVYSFEATETATYRAHFEYIDYTISAEANPEEGGTITGTSNMAHYNSTCQLIAHPNTGYRFVNWTLNGVEMSTDEIYDFNVTGSAHYVANFSMDSYEVTVVADPAEGGTVTGAGTYDSGTMATVSVTPNENYLFENWTLNGTVVSEDYTYSFVVTEDCLLVAHLHFFDNVNENGTSALLVYPNPTQDKVNLRGVAMHSVKVFDAIGQMVIMKECDNTENVELDLSGLAPGFYTVSVRTTDGALLDKVVIKK